MKFTYSGREAKLAQEKQQWNSVDRIIIDAVNCGRTKCFINSDILTADIRKELQETGYRVDYYYSVGSYCIDWSHS